MDKPYEAIIAIESHLPVQSNNTNPRRSQTRKRSSREGVNWSRSGCLTCKKRRKRCDEAKPSCHNCTRLGRVCEGYGSMWTEPLSPSAQVFQQRPAERSKRRRLGLLLESPACSGSDVFSSGSVPSIQPSACSSPYASSSSVQCDDSYSPTGIDGNLQVPSSISGEIEEEVTSFPTNSTTHIDSADMILQPRRCISHLTTLETHYLQYHVEQGSKLLANLENDENPLRSLLIPRALSSPLLMNAVCAVSAMHFSNRLRHNNNNSWSNNAQTAAANYYVRALRGLRTTITNYYSNTGSFPEEALLTVALLCKYEIVRGSVKQWAGHLNALQKLIISRGGFATLDCETAEFLRGLMIYCQNMAKVTNSGQQANNATLLPSSVYDTEPGSIPKLDIYIGYTEEIVKIFSRIADLRLLLGSNDDIGALDEEVYTINESLRTWTHTKRQYIIPKGITQATLTRLRMVADCFRDAAYIYLHSTLERISQRHRQEEQEQPESNLNLNPKSQIPSPLHRCLTRINSFSPLTAHCEFSALTFPLFIAGCETETAAQREIVIRSLDALEGNFGIGNVGRAKEVLGVVWKEKGKEIEMMKRMGGKGKGGGGRGHWLDVLEGSGWELILA